MRGDWAAVARLRPSRRHSGSSDFIGGGFLEAGEWSVSQKTKIWAKFSHTVDRRYCPFVPAIRLFFYSVAYL